MPKIKRSKTNTMFFQDIPKPDQWREDLYNMLKERYRLVEQRRFNVEQKREAHKKIYNLSLELRELDDKISDWTFKNVINGGTQ